MAIRTVQSRTRNSAAYRVFESIGVLRKGGPKESARKPGEELEHWRFTSDNPDVMQAFEDAFGKEPKVLKGVFLAGGETVKDVFDPWCEQWGGGGAGQGTLQHRCDGEICVLWRDSDGNMISDPDQLQQHPCPGKCAWVGRLSVIIPELWEAGHVGVVKVETHSKVDIYQWSDALEEAYKTATSHNGNGLAGVDFTLSREMGLVNAPRSGGGKMRVKKCFAVLRAGDIWRSAIDRKSVV